jgi:hypothetical protein
LKLVCLQLAIISLLWTAAIPCSAFFGFNPEQTIKSIEGYRFHSIDRKLFETLTMDFESIRSINDGTSCSNLTKWAYESEIKAKSKSLDKIEKNINELANFAKRNPEIIELYPKGKISISLRPRCDRNIGDDTASPVRVVPHCGISSREHCIEYSFYVPDLSNIELQPNILYHEVGHMIFRSLMHKLNTGAELAIEEAFADFFAYSVSKDPIMGTYYDNKTKTTRVIRKIKSSLNLSNAFDPRQDWGFSQMNSDVYSAGAKFRDALILISESQGFNKALETIKRIISRANEIRALDPGPSYEKNVACVEQACREIFSQYFE